jgi:hypothetical protein
MSIGAFLIVGSYVVITFCSNLIVVYLCMFVVGLGMGFAVNIFLYIFIVLKFNIYLSYITVYDTNQMFMGLLS